MTADGTTYTIDPEWTDSNHAVSGLRCVNHEGIKFESVPLATDLLSGWPGSYIHVLKHADGSRDIDSDDLCLDHIEDSWHLKVTVTF